MLFLFLKYVNPVWYYNLPSRHNALYFCDNDKVPTDELDSIDLDEGYENLSSTNLDAAYQMWHKGFIKNAECALDAIVSPISSVTDNYRFVRRHFHPIWSWYILSLRILTLHNPFRETRAFFSQRNTKRLDHYSEVFPHDQAYNNFNSSLLNSGPMVSVIIPTLNRYPHLTNALEDLEKQEYPNFEVIVIDQSTPFAADFYKSFQLKLTVHQQSEKALWQARNTAIKLSKANLILLFDDDSRVEPDWISEHVKCLDYFQADISAGVSFSRTGDRIPENYRFFRWADKLDTGNVMIHRKVFEVTGLFDRQFEGQRMGDGEFGLRAYLAGFKSISNCRAKRLHLKVGKGGLREMGSWDAYRPKSFWAPRPIPSVLYFFRKYFPSANVWHAVIIGILPSLIPYRYKANRALLFLGSILTIILLPKIGVQVWRSWRASSRMLQEGAKIDTL